MNLSHSVAVFVASIALAGHSPAQQPEQNRPTMPQERPPAAQPTVPVVVPPNVPPPTPAMLAAQRRREEQSVDLDELLAHVSQTTGKKFLVDPRVRLSVYAVPKIEAPTYGELLTILRMHGFAAVEIQGRVNIVPDAVVRSLPVRVLNRDDNSVPDDEYVTRVITTPNANYLVPVLRPLMSQAAHLAATGGGESGPGDKLILMDTYANVRRMTEIINSLSR
jgi:type II secretory pathway component GspD/PulD (secretin)